MSYTVLHLIDTTGPGGAEDVFISLAAKLQSAHVRNIAVIRGEGYVASTLRKHGIEPIIIDSKGSFNVAFIRKMLGIIRQYDVKLIQSHLLGSNVYASIVGLVSRTPVVATYHGMVDVSPNERFKSIKLWFMRHGISHFVSVSKSLKNAIMENKLLIPSKTSVIYNGIDTNAYQIPRSNALKERLNIAKTTPLIGALGNIRKSKRYDLLVKAAILLKERGVEAAFCIAGDPKARLKQPLEAMIKQHQLDNIHFVGFVDNTPQYLSSLDGFILTSDAEGFSISTIEAMATGLPVIATRCGGPEEIIADQRQGSLVDISEHAIAEAVNQLIAQIKQLAPSPIDNEAARKRVKDTFSIEAMLAQYQKIYQTIDNSFPIESSTE